MLNNKRGKMAFTAVEIIALILILVSLIKIIVILINPQSWYNNVAKKVFGSMGLVSVVSLILAAVVLYYLLQELTIIQILATMAFLSLLMVVGIAAYAKEVVPLVDKLYKDKTLVKRSWLYILVWIALLLWGLKELFL